MKKSWTIECTPGEILYLDYKLGNFTAFTVRYSTITNKTSIAVVNRVLPRYSGGLAVNMTADIDSVPCKGQAYDFLEAVQIAFKNHTRVARMDYYSKKLGCSVNLPYVQQYKLRNIKFTLPNEILNEMPIEDLPF